MHDDLHSKSEAECTEMLDKIFAGNQALLAAIAPDGWMNSQYVHFFHPTPEQQLKQYNRVSENLARLSKKKKGVTDNEPLKTISDFQMDDLENVNGHDEFIQVLGNAVWDIFSDNHEVIAEDGMVYDLGSFRGSGDTIADFINDHYPLSKGALDYMDFYMSTAWTSERADIMPFYKYIFMVLKENNCDWHYSFPRLGLVSFEKEEPGDSDPAKYDPFEAVQKELSDEKAEVDELRKELDEIYEQEYEEAKYKPLPLTVSAYKEVYGILPGGHPQKEFE